MITNWKILADGEYRVFAQGWWADIEYRWDRDTDAWRVMILDSSAYGVVPLRTIALAANGAIGMGEVPPEKLRWADTGGSVVDSGRGC